jgi:hypothetical protein
MNETGGQKRLRSYVVQFGTKCVSKGGGDKGKGGGTQKEKRNDGGTVKKDNVKRTKTMRYTTYRTIIILAENVY